MHFLPANPPLPVATTLLVPMPLPGTETRQYRRICARESPAGTKSLRMTLGKDNAGNLARLRGAGSRNGVGGFASARAGLPAGGRAVEDLRPVAGDRDLDCGGMLAADGGDAVEAQPVNRRLRTRCSRCCARRAASPARRRARTAAKARLRVAAPAPGRPDSSRRLSWRSLVRLRKSGAVRPGGRSRCGARVRCRSARVAPRRSELLSEALVKRCMQQLTR